MQDELKPVAWMYQGPAMLEDETIIQDKKCFPIRQAYMPSGWTETPLYAHPPTTNPVDDRETPVGDHQKVEAVDRVLIEAIINDYHTTRLDRDYVPHILSKPRTIEAFARHRQAALTAARAQVEAENQRLREALEWALAELRGRTRYDNEAQRLNCFDNADAALAAGEHRKDAP